VANVVLEILSFDALVQLSQLHFRLSDNPAFIPGFFQDPGDARLKRSFPSSDRIDPGHFILARDRALERPLEHMIDRKRLYQVLSRALAERINALHPRDLS